MKMIVVLAIASLVPTGDADACSPPPCWPGFFVPEVTTQIPAIPANTPGLYWRPMRDNSNPGADPSKLTLALASDPTTPLAFAATPLENGDFVLVPDAPLVVGEAYTLGDASTCESPFGGVVPPSSSFVVDPPLPLPTTLGTLTAVHTGIATIDIGTAIGLCSLPIVAERAEVALEVTPELAPWVPVLHFETFVDGRRWHPISSINDSVAPGQSWRGRTRDLVYAACESIGDGGELALEPGEHVVEMRATLPGSPLVVASTQAPVILSCGEPPPCDANNSCTEIDKAGCNAGGGTPSASGGLLLLALAVLLRRRN